jgi:hypothetical protein
VRWVKRSIDNKRLSQTHGRTVPSMMSRVHQETDDRRLPESPARLQSVQTFDKDQPFAILAHQDRGGLAGFQHAFGDRLDGFRIECLAPLYRNIDLFDGKDLILQHGHLQDARLEHGREIT